MRIATLDRIATGGQDWAQVAGKYGVTNPVPPWKSSLDGICDALDTDGQALPALERRDDEDALSEAVYADLPAPERQLVALATPASPGASSTSRTWRAGWTPSARASKRLTSATSRRRCEARTAAG